LYIFGGGELKGACTPGVIKFPQPQEALYAACAYAWVGSSPGVCWISPEGPLTALRRGLLWALDWGIGIICFLPSQKEEMPAKAQFSWEGRVSLSSLLQEAHRASMEGRPGPACVYFKREPELQAVLEHLKGIRRRPKVPPRDSPPFDLLKIIEDLQRPLLLVAEGIGDREEARLFRLGAEALGIPVLSTLPGLGVFPEDHPLYLGLVGPWGHPCALKALEESEALFVWGGNPKIWREVKALLPPGADLIPLLPPGQKGEGQVISLGSWRPLLELVAKRSEAFSFSPWRERIKHWRNNCPLTYDQGLPWLVERLGEITRGKAVLVAEGEILSAALHYGYTEPRGCLLPAGYALTGFAFPAALGAALAARSRQIWVLTQGGCRQDILKMARQLGLPLKVLLLSQEAGVEGEEGVAALIKAFVSQELFLIQCKYNNQSTLLGRKAEEP